MADAPWRCSECGTINEPVANSCRNCGRWPSLFDLQESVYEETPAERERDVGEFEVGTFRPETLEPQPYEVEPVADGSPAPEGAEEPETPGDRRRRVVTSLIVPLAFVVYIVISIVFGDRGSS